MEKRVLLAVVLSFVVLTVFRAYLPAPKRVTSAPVAASSASPAEPVAAAQTSASAPNGAAAPPPSAPAATSAATVAESAEREIVVTTNLVRAVFSNRGGVLTHWTLLKYADHEGKPADLIPAGLPPTMARPFALRLSDPQRNAVVNTALYRTAGGDAIDVRDKRVTLEFDYSDQSGFSVHKTFVIEPRSYVITFTARVIDGEKAIN